MDSWTVIESEPGRAQQQVEIYQEVRQWSLVSRWLNHEQVSARFQADHSTPGAQEYVLRKSQAILLEFQEALANYQKDRVKCQEDLGKSRNGLAEYQEGLEAYQEDLETYREVLEINQEVLAEYQEGLAEYQEGLEKYRKGLERDPLQPRSHWAFYQAPHSSSEAMQDDQGMGPGSIQEAHAGQWQIVGQHRSVEMPFCSLLEPVQNRQPLAMAMEDLAAGQTGKSRGGRSELPPTPYLAED